MKKISNTKKQIIEATKRLVKTQSQVTIKEICEASYVNIAAINYHFGNKASLMQLVIAEIVEQLQKEMIDYLKTVDNITPEVGLSHVIELILKFAIENKGLIHYLFVASENDGTVSYYGIVQNFLFDNPFASTIITKLNLSKEFDPQILHSRFLILFSALSMPMIMEFAVNKGENRDYSIDNPVFKEKYINELIKILK